MSAPKEDSPLPAGKLAHALSWAARGFRVFPLQENGKLPLNGQGWLVSATTDPADLREMWSCPVTGTERDCNIGVLTNDLAVIDVDVKAGKQGPATVEQLGLKVEGTLIVRTPSRLLKKGVAGL